MKHGVKSIEFWASSINGWRGVKWFYLFIIIIFFTNSVLVFIILYYIIYWTDYIDDEYTSIIIDFCIDTNMNADIIVVDSCGTNGDCDWQNDSNNSFYFLIFILCSFNISMNGDAFFLSTCILLLLLYSHFYYICSYFIIFYCFFFFYYTCFDKFPFLIYVLLWNAQSIGIIIDHFPI